MAKDVSAGLSTAAAGRRFGFTVGSAFLVLSVIAAWRDHTTTMRVLGAVGVVLGVAALLVPAALGPVERFWMATAHAISRVTTPIVMGLLFFAVITPIGVVRRVFGHRGLVRAKSGETAWHSRDVGRRRGDLNRQF